jgi:hypothetical protein
MNEEEQSLQNGSPGELKFHYSREERIRKRHKPQYDRKSNILFRKKRRGLIIIVVDVILIAVVFFYIIKPANVLLTKQKSDLVYELNITGVRGGKVLIGFTIRNEGSSAVSIRSDSVTVTITDRNNDTKSFHAFIEQKSELEPGESSSTVFLLDRQDLPSSGLTELFYDGGTKPLFSRNVRF